MGNHVIYDRLWESDKLARCSMLAALAYPWIFLVADDHGRFEYKPRAIWKHAFAYRGDVTVEDVAGWIDEYWKAGLLIRYHIQDEDGSGGLAHWYKFKGRKPSDRRPSEYPDPAGIPELPPPSATTPPRRGDDTATPPRQTRARDRAEIEQRQSGVENPPPAILAPREVTWSNEAANDWTEAKGGPAPKGIFAPLKHAVTVHGWLRVRPVWRHYLASTPGEFVNASKFVAAFGEWETRSRGQPAAGQKQTPGNATMAAAARVLARHEGGGS